MIIQHPIYISAETKIEFRTDDTNEVRAKVTTDELVENSVKVVLPELQCLKTLGTISTAVKIQCLLNNYHLQPVYSTQSKQVSFKPIAASSKKWEKRCTMSLPNGKISLLNRRDSCLSYSFLNTVTTWDWKNDQYRLTSFDFPQITAMSESSDGKLIAGSAQGKLQLEGSPPLSLKVNSPIKEIISLSNGSHYFVKFENGETQLIEPYFNSQICRKTKIQGDQILVLGNGTLVILYREEKKLKILSFDSILKSEYKTRFVEYTGGEIHSIQALSATSILILDADKQHITIWNNVTEKSKFFKNKDLWEHAKRVIYLDENRLAYQIGKMIHFISTKTGEEEFIISLNTGQCQVTSLIFLSDDSMMFATDTTPPGIHVMSQECKSIFSSKSLVDKRNVDKLIELVNGCVAVQCIDTSDVIILQPKIEETMLLLPKVENENRAYLSKLIKLELLQNPMTLELYHQLAEISDNKGERYQTYLAGLGASMKQDNLYSARRFYEKARKIYPSRIEPCQSFLAFLENGPYAKQKKQVLLDLYALQSANKLKPPLGLDPEKKCKNILLIGENDFSFTEALLNKHKKTHKQLPLAITATELGAPPQSAWSRIASLQERKVKILFGIDGTLIHKTFKGKRFEHIQWNCPFSGGSQSEKEAFKSVMPAFFESCSKLQLFGDQVHVTLIQDSRLGVRQMENPIVFGATSASYRLIRKNNFGAERYPGYIHTKTGSGSKWNSEGVEREFVFEKTEIDNSYEKDLPLLVKAFALKDPKEKNYDVKTLKKSSIDLKDYYFECSTDEDSSDLYGSD